MWNILYDKVNGFNYQLGIGKTKYICKEKSGCFYSRESKKRMDEEEGGQANVQRDWHNAEWKMFRARIKEAIMWMKGMG